MFQVYPQNIPDISAGCITCIYGRYKGELPYSVKAKGCLADMSAIEIDLKVEHAKDMRLEKVNIFFFLLFIFLCSYLYAFTLKQCACLYNCMTCFY